MSVIEKLSTSLKRRDEVPNTELAKQIASKKDKKAIRELVDLLSNKNKDIQNDCIKVLYEIGERNPALIEDYANDFIALLNHKNNRLQWGAMTALHTITTVNPKLIFATLPKIVEASNKGSVITKDQAVNILITLCSVKAYSGKAFLLLNEQLISCPTNQLPMYAERALPIINDKNKKLFKETLHSRMNEIVKDSKKKRIEKIMKELKALPAVRLR